MATTKKTIQPVIEEKEIKEVKEVIKANPTLQDALDYMTEARDILINVSQERRKAGQSDTRTGYAYRELSGLIKRLQGL